MANITFTEGDLQKILKRRAQFYLDKNQWPLKNFELKKAILNFINMEIRVTATLSMEIKAKGFSFLTQEKDLNKLKNLKIEAFRKMNNILWKLIAIELESQNSGLVTSEIDGIKFIIIPRTIDTNEKALNFYKNRIQFLKYKLSFAKGKIDQAIYRKGLINLSGSEKKRRILKKSTEFLFVYKKELKKIITNPLSCYKAFIKKAIDKNTQIKLN